MIMKKAYINPEMLIIKVGTQQMLADSKMEFGNPTTTMDAPSYDWDDEYDEE